MIKSWDDYADLLAALHQIRREQARRAFAALIDQAYTAQQLARYGVKSDGPENVRDSEL